MGTCLGFPKGKRNLNQYTRKEIPMRARQMKMSTFFAALLVCGLFMAQTTSTALAFNPTVCKREIDETIKFLKKAELYRFSGKKMVKALEDYRDGIDKKEFDNLDYVMGPFDEDEHIKIIKKIMGNLEIIKVECKE